eukprot:SAG31_NODE_1303_length_8898_cov_11.100693_2_plen_1166_part_00
MFTDLIFKPSIPPELSEKPKIEPPVIPDDASPEETKTIVEQHAEVTRQKMKQRMRAILALGPSALKVTGEWVCKSAPAESWFRINGSLIEDKGPNGHITVTFANAKRLLMIVIMCILSSAPALGGWQINLLVVLTLLDLVLTIRFQPFRDRFKNMETILIVAIMVVQMGAPILLLFGVIEDQYCALFMMATSVAIQFIGVATDGLRSLWPVLKLVGKTLFLLLQIVVVALIFMRYLKRRIKKVHVAPPPPVWTIIKTPDILVKLLDYVLGQKIFEIMKGLMVELNVPLTEYATTFSKLAARWVKEDGAQVLETQFREVIDKKRTEVDLSEYIGLFHRGASMHVYHTMQTTVKEQSQSLYDGAVKTAQDVEKRKNSIRAGTNILAAADEIMSPEMMKKITDIAHKVAPILKTYATAVVKMQATWLSETGQALIDEAQQRLEQVAETGLEISNIETIDRTDAQTLKEIVTADELVIDDAAAASIDDHSDKSDILNNYSDSAVAIKIERLQAEIDELQQQADSLALDSHIWRKIFDVIEPGGVLTVDDFKFELHKIEVHLSDQQFNDLVFAIDSEHDGALTYEKFADYFERENNEINAQYLSSEAELARFLWDAADVDGSGELDVEEVRTLFKTLGENLSHKELDAAFARMDKDGDGSVCFDEFKLWFDEQHYDEMSVAVEAKKISIQEAWASVNTTGQEEVGMTEISKMFELMGRKLPEQCLEKEFNDIDIHGTGTITYSELIEWWTKHSKEELDNFRHYESALDDIHDIDLQLEEKKRELTGLLGQMPATDAAASVAADGLSTIASGMPDLGITIPSADFHKIALVDALDSYRAKITALGGVVNDKAAAIVLSTEATLVEQVRSLSQLMQLRAIHLARENIVPELEKRIKDLQLPGPFIRRKVLTLCAGLAEKELRKATHSTVFASFEKVNAQVCLPGCTTNASLDVVGGDAEDECGHLLSKGGYKSAEFGLLQDSNANNKFSSEMHKVIDPNVVKMITGKVGFLGELLQQYGETAVTASKHWEEKDGAVAIEQCKELAAVYVQDTESVRARLAGFNLLPAVVKTIENTLGQAKQTEDEKFAELMLKLVRVPTWQFHKEGLTRVIEEFKLRLLNAGGLLAQLAEEIKITRSSTTLEVRRALNQFVQEYIVGKLTEDVLPCVLFNNP